ASRSAAMISSEERPFRAMSVSPFESLEIAGFETYHWNRIGGAGHDPFQTAIDWLGRAVEPVAMVGIVLVFAFLVLLDRSDLRDRLLRMLGGNLHRSTDALEEAGNRISKYLLMQLIVNVS